MMQKSTRVSILLLPSVIRTLNACNMRGIILGLPKALTLLPFCPLLPLE